KVNRSLSNRAWSGLPPIAPRRKPRREETAGQEATVRAKQRRNRVRRKREASRTLLPLPFRGIPLPAISRKPRLHPRKAPRYCKGNGVEGIPSGIPARKDSAT